MVLKELIATLGLEVDEVAFEKGEAAIEGLHHGLMAFGAAAIAGLAIAAAAIVKTTAEALDNSKKLAQSSGLDADVFQRWSYAASLSEISAEELGHAMQHLGKTGIKDVNAEMLRLSEQFEKMPDSGEKTRLAMLKFGRAGARLIPVLNKGKKELKELMDEAHPFGKEDLKNAEKFNEALKRLEYQMGVFKNILGVGMLEAFTAVINAMTKWVKFAQENWKPILKAIAIGIGAIIIALGILEFEAIAAAVAAAAAWIIAALPFIAIVAAIAFVLLALEDLYQFLTGGESVIGHLDEYVTKTFGDWPGLFQGVLDKIGDMWPGLWEGIKTGFIWAITTYKDLFLGFWGWIGKMIKNLGGWIIDQLKESFRMGVPQEMLKGILGAGIPGAGAVMSMFGSGSSPAASVSSSVNTSKAPVVSAPTFNAPITVNASPGMDTTDLANKTADAWEDKINAWNRQTEAGLTHG